MQKCINLYYCAIVLDNYCTSMVFKQNIQTIALVVIFNRRNKSFQKYFIIYFLNNIPKHENPCSWLFFSL